MSSCYALAKEASNFDTEFHFCLSKNRPSGMKPYSLLNQNFTLRQANCVLNLFKHLSTHSSYKMQHQMLGQLNVENVFQ